MRAGKHASKRRGRKPEPPAFVRRSVYVSPEMAGLIESRALVEESSFAAVVRDILRGHFSQAAT